MTAAAFTYADLFAGIGGFHAVLDAMGGECVYAAEIDPAAQRVYQANWGILPTGLSGTGDVTLDTTDEALAKPNGPFPEIDVLVAGFPCQSFSKSGAQLGMEDARGTLFFEIMRVVEARRPIVVLLENVRNLVGPRHIHEWEVIVAALRKKGYRISGVPAVFSPALLSPERGGHPQTRDRVFIAATREFEEEPDESVVDMDAVVDPISLPIDVLMPRNREWNLREHLPLDEGDDIPGTAVSEAEWEWIDTWGEWVQMMRAMLASEADREERVADALPGYPIWAHVWTVDEKERADLRREAHGMAWKLTFLTRNWDLYERLLRYDNGWTARWLDRVWAFPPSRQKLEWQAQDAVSIRDCVISLRPSGLRVKRMTHLPALVAITQTPILGPLGRRLSVTEAARLQGLPDAFSFAGQRDAASYKQMGNGVNTGVVAQALLAQVDRDADLLTNDRRGKRVLAAVRETMAATGGDLRPRIDSAVRAGQARAASAP